MAKQLLWARRHKSGFTIVELLIVVVVIGILAAIVIVAYNGIQNRANDAAAESDVRKIGLALQNYATINGSLPTSEALLKTLLDSSEVKGKITRGSYDTSQAATLAAMTFKPVTVLCVLAAAQHRR